jgi:STE24 endopeptidase
MDILYCMNDLAVFILASLILKFGIELLADLLNIKALQFQLPPALQDLYNPGDYRKSQQYLRVSTIFGLVENTFSLSVTLVFWFSGGFNFLDNIVRSWSFIPIINGLLYIGIIFLAYNIITLPFGIYDTFVIEQHFGFNRATPQTFIMDRVKILVLGVLIGGALLAGVLVLFQYAGSFAWVYCWIGIIIFSIVVQFIAPAWIMPIFNKFTPMAPGKLREAILTYTHSVNFPVKNIFVIDGSKRSSKSNAFFTGLGANKRIALFDTLIEKHNTAEIVAILAHEIGHYKKKHITQGIIINIFSSGLTLFLFSLCINQPALYQAFDMEHQYIYTGVVFFDLLYTPLGLVFSIVMAWISRQNESAADRFAAETIDEPARIVEALKKLSTMNLTNLTPHPLYVFIKYTHPPLLQRLQMIEKQIVKEK